MTIKTIFITGGTGKIGYRLVEHFLNCGHKVITNSRDPKKLSDIEEQLDNPANLYSCVVDLEKKNSVDQIIKFCKSKELCVTTIINNARNIDYLKIDDGWVDRENWYGEYLLNVIIPYEVSVKFSSAFNSLETVINISSMYGVVPANPNLYQDFENQSAINYNVAKAAEVHLTKELAVRLSYENITVNSISFGGVKGKVNQEFLQRYSELTLSGDMLETNDVLSSVAFFTEHPSKHMTGQNLVVDGGWSLW